MKTAYLATIIALCYCLPACADGKRLSHSHALHSKGAVVSKADSNKTAAFDILAAHVHQQGGVVTFHMTTNGVAGSQTPNPVGSLAGAPAATYVWPTSLDPSTVGFDEGAGILSMVAASHPDFDDTPFV